MMTTNPHIPLTQLALYSRGDLGFWHRKLVERHLDRCEECGTAALEFSQIEENIRLSASQMPPALEGSAWQSLASEMSANIRLGLAAGECVSFHSPGSRSGFVSRPRLSLALAGLTVLAVLVAMEHPVSRSAPVTVQAQTSQSTLEASGDEVMVSSGDRGLSVPAPAGSNVIRTVSAHGAVRSRYVDDTGVTIVNVYAE